MSNIILLLRHEVASGGRIQVHYKLQRPWGSLVFHIFLFFFSFSDHLVLFNFIHHSFTLDSLHVIGNDVVASSFKKKNNWRTEWNHRHELGWPRHARISHRLHLHVFAYGESSRYVYIFSCSELILDFQQPMSAVMLKKKKKKKKEVEEDGWNHRHELGWPMHARVSHRLHLQQPTSRVM